MVAVFLSAAAGGAIIKLCMPPLIIAGITAAAALAAGIASGAGAKVAADTQSEQAAKDRAVQERIQRLQLAEQRRQQTFQRQQEASGALSAGLQNAATAANRYGAENATAADDVRSALARGYLEK